MRFGLFRRQIGVMHVLLTFAARKHGRDAHATGTQPKLLKLFLREALFMSIRVHSWRATQSLFVWLHALFNPVYLTNSRVFSEIHRITVMDAAEKAGVSADWLSEWGEVAKAGHHFDDKRNHRFGASSDRCAFIFD
jgi:hypothetical protein